MSASNCCFLTGIEVSQDEGKVVWYSCLFKNVPVCCDPHSQSLYSVVNEAEVDVSQNSLAFSVIQGMLAIWSQVPLPFLHPACTSGSSWFVYRWSLVWRILNITSLAHEMSATVWSFKHFFGIAILWDWNENWPCAVMWPLLNTECSTWTASFWKRCYYIVLRTNWF